MADTIDTAGTASSMGNAAGSSPKPVTTPLDTGGSDTGAGESPNHRAEARSRFNAALEEAKAGMQALKAGASERGANYRSMAADSRADWVEDAKAMSDKARKQAEDLAVKGKARASDGISALGRAVSDTAAVIDDKLGAKYGDYARSAARSMQETAARLEAKELDELGNDVKAYVRKSPGTALGIAAVAGFFLARLLGIGKSD